MPNVTERKGTAVRKDLYRLLKKRADENHRSVCGELNHILETILKKKGAEA